MTGSRHGLPDGFGTGCDELPDGCRYGMRSPAGRTMFNFQMLMAAKQAKEKFMNNHPKVETFIDDVNSKGFCADQEIAVAVRYPDGTEYKTGIRVTESDLQLLNMLKGLTK